MPTISRLTLACAIFVGAMFTSAHAAEREQVRMVINLVSGVKMPFPRNLQNNQSRTERVQLDTNGATVACLRLDDKVRWCFEHIAPVGARAEMLRITNEPVAGLLVGQLFHYVDDFDLDGSVDIGSTTRLDGQPHAPVGSGEPSSSSAAPTAAINFAATTRSSMTRASRSHSSTWANDDFAMAAHAVQASHAASRSAMPPLHRQLHRGNTASEAKLFSSSRRTLTAVPS